MDRFDIEKIRDGFYSINDAGNSSFYVVEGQERAAVVDTGITAGAKILPVIRSITQKPLVLVVTHGHIDHMHHMDEFEEVYLSHEELKLSPAMRAFMSGGKDLDWAAAKDLRTGDRISLGGEDLEICALPGHSPGSIIAYDQKRELLFTGDAIGSGCGVWMQCGTSTSLDVYYAALIKALKWLVDRGGRMEFWGGHNRQSAMSQAVPGHNPLSLGLLADMVDLVGKILSGALTGTPTDVGHPEGMQGLGADDPILYAAYGRAEILYVEADIHQERYLKY